MRRARRSRIGLNYEVVLNHMVVLATKDDNITLYLKNGERNRAFGRLLNKFMDSSKESVIDRYVDKDAFKVVHHALNKVAVN